MLTRASALHYWDAMYGLHPVVGGRGAFSRASAAYMADRAGLVQLVIANVPRIQIEQDLRTRRPQLLLEKADAGAGRAVEIYKQMLTFFATPAVVYLRFRPYYSSVSVDPQYLFELGEWSATATNDAWLLYRSGTAFYVYSAANGVFSVANTTALAWAAGDLVEICAVFRNGGTNRIYARVNRGAIGIGTIVTNVFKGTAWNAEAAVHYGMSRNGGGSNSAYFIQSKIVYASHLDAPEANSLAMMNEMEAFTLNPAGDVT
jgi:hypothetical protein